MSRWRFAELTDVPMIVRTMVHASLCVVNATGAVERWKTAFEPAHPRAVSVGADRLMRRAIGYTSHRSRRHVGNWGRARTWATGSRQHVGNCGPAGTWAIESRRHVGNWHAKPPGFFAECYA